MFRFPLIVYKDFLKNFSTILWASAFLKQEFLQNSGKHGHYLNFFNCQNQITMESFWNYSRTVIGILIWNVEIKGTWKMKIENRSYWCCIINPELTRYTVPMTTNLLFTAFHMLRLLMTNWSMCHGVAPVCCCLLCLVFLRVMRMVNSHSYVHT